MTVRINMVSKATGKARHPHDKTRPSPKAVKAAIAKGDMNSLFLALTPRQRAFCKEYLVDFDATNACIRAGYSPKYPNRMATILLHHSGVAAYIEHLKLSTEAKTRAINPDWVLQKIVTNVNTAEDRANLSAVFRGLELLARHFGMLKDRQEISGPDGDAIRIQQEEVQKEAESLKLLIEALSQKREFVITDGNG